MRARVRGVICMYRVTLICNGLPKGAGQEAATDIQNEFLENRDWHSNVVCSWDGEKLKLVAENDFDQDGQALLDEFGDCIAAYVIDYFDSNIKIESVNEI